MLMPCWWLTMAYVILIDGLRNPGTRPSVLSQHTACLACRTPSGPCVLALVWLTHFMVSLLILPPCDLPTHSWHSAHDPLFKALTCSKSCSQGFPVVHCPLSPQPVHCSTARQVHLLHFRACCSMCKLVYVGSCVGA